MADDEQPSPMDETTLVELVNDDLLGQWRTEVERLTKIDQWARWDHGVPHAPQTATKEYKELSERAQAPWLALVVESVVQGLYVEGYRRSDSEDNSAAWKIWQRNGMDARQIAIHQDAVRYGTGYATVLPGETLSGEIIPSIRGVSPRRMMTFYEDQIDDDWPQMAMRVDLNGDKLKVRLYDSQFVYYLEGGRHGSVEYKKTDQHGVGVCPVVRYVNAIDNDGRTNGEVEPFIALASRIDQTTFDRLVVQRFGAWVVRTIAGMAKPDPGDSTELEKMRLRAEDILVAEDADTRFGSLPATPLDGFIKAYETDISTLAAVSQTPAHEMLGQIANLSAEALEAARASRTGKIDQRQHLLGEAHEQLLRLSAKIAGDSAGADDYEAEVRWKDTSIRSLAQASDALGKLATMLGVPVEILWEKIPGWTQQDVERAKSLVQEGGGLDALLRELAESEEPAAIEAT